jgi:hypothetical protein
MQTFSALLQFFLLSTVPNCQILTNAFYLLPIPVKDVSQEVRCLLNVPTRQRKIPYSSLSSTSDNDIYSDDDDAIDVDAVRKHLESLVSSNGKCNFQRENKVSKGSHLSSTLQLLSFPPMKGISLEADLTGGIDFSLSHPPPMTTIDRERKRFEINALRALEYGDETLSELWELWFHERGPDVAARLYEADELTGNGPMEWDRAESILLELVNEFGVHWPEPVNRLATLYYLKGNLRASEAAYLSVLAVKPWHFGALSSLVKIYAGLNDAENARFWAARRLPTFAPIGPNRRREQWVQVAVDQALEKLSIAEESLLESFGNFDTHVAELDQRNEKVRVIDDESWQ